MCLGRETRWLIEGGEFVSAGDGIGHWCKLEVYHGRSGQPTVNPIEVQHKRDIPKPEKRGKQTPKNAERGYGLDHRLQHRAAWLRDGLVHQHDPGAIACMRCAGKMNKEPERTACHWCPLIVPFLNMPRVMPLTKALGRTSFKTTGAPPVTTACPQQMPFQIIRLLIRHRCPPRWCWVRDLVQRLSPCREAVSIRKTRAQARRM